MAKPTRAMDLRCYLIYRVRISGHNCNDNGVIKTDRSVPIQSYAIQSYAIQSVLSIDSTNPILRNPILCNPISVRIMCLALMHVESPLNANCNTTPSQRRQKWALCISPRVIQLNWCTCSASICWLFSQNGCSWECWHVHYHTNLRTIQQRERDRLYTDT